jgi:Na+/proline symporter
MLFSAGMYVFNHENVVAEFTKLNYPAYLIYPLATAKLLGVLAIVTKKSETLKNWAYTAFFFNIVLAFFAHVMVRDGMFAGALVGLLFWTLSYTTERKLRTA